MGGPEGCLPLPLGVDGDRFRDGFLRGVCGGGGAVVLGRVGVLGLLMIFFLLVDGVLTGG